jgi:hypothetical protein
LVLVVLLGACAADEPVRKTSPESTVQKIAVETPESAEPADEPPAENPKGPIDLGMGDDEEGEIVIDRPKAPEQTTTDIEELASKTYEQACKSVDDCEGLDALECDGEMACTEGQCVYACTGDDDEDEVDVDAEFIEEDVEL